MSGGDLLPCPFCGGGDTAIVVKGYQARYRVECCRAVNGPSCGARTTMYDERAEAIAAWNRRTPIAGEGVGEAYRRGAEDAAAQCIRLCRQLGEQLDEGPCDATGWPITPDGAARHEAFAIASAIEESVQHEAIRHLIEAALSGKREG